MNKLVTKEQCLKLVQQYRNQSKSIGFSSGVFDLLHFGHADYLRRAKEQVDILIVAINSDSSVTKLKGSRRPIVSQDERANLLANLESVDHIFIFDELNNNLNVELIKPDIYFKAGDYDISKLSSAPIVQKNGGKIVVIPAQAGLSSSNIIKTIVERYSEPDQLAHYKNQASIKPALFVDRDGTLIELVDYLHQPEKVKLIDKAARTVKQISDLGFHIVIVTNQAGIGLGYFTVEDLFSVNRKMLKDLKQYNLMVDKIYYCPHNEKDNCQCRKPNPGMLIKAANDLKIVKERSIIVGDFQSDVEAGKAYGCDGVLIRELSDWDKLLALAKTKI